MGKILTNKKNAVLFLMLMGMYVLLSVNNSLHAQNVGIGTTSFTPDAAAMLEIRSPSGNPANSKGLLIPRVTYADRPSGVGAGSNGMLIYQTDDNGTETHGFYYWDNTITTWLPFLSSSASSSTAGWLTLGNDGTNALTNFIGTKDNQSLTIRTNNVQRIRVDSMGLVGIGTTIPVSTLHVVSSGAKTADFTSTFIENSATSSTASISKFGLEVQSTGTWDGASSTNTGIVVNDVSGGTLNYDAVFNGGANNTVGIGTFSPDNGKLQIATASTINGFAGLRIDHSGATTAGYGIYVTKTGASTINYGGRFFANNGTVSNIGIRGETSSYNGTGVLGANSSTSAVNSYGVQGSKSGNMGTGTGYAVQGNATGTADVNYGGYFQASGGTLNVGGYFNGTNYSFVTPAVGGNAGVGTETPNARFHVYESVSAREVMRIENVSPGTDRVSERIYQGGITTVGATTSQILVVAIPTGYTVIIEARIVARDATNSTSAGYGVYGTYRNNAGTVTAVGGPTQLWVHENTAGWNSTFAISGTNVNVNGTGSVAGATVTWHATVRVYMVQN